MNKSIEDGKGKNQKNKGMKVNRSDFLKKKNLLKKTDKQKKPISKTKRSQSVTTKKLKNKITMSKTNRSAIIRGRKNNWSKTKKKINNYLNRTTQSEKKGLKKRFQSVEIKKRSRTPNVSRYNNKFVGKKFNRNKFSKTNIRTNKKKITQRTFNNIKRDRIKGYKLFTEENEKLKRKNTFNTFQQRGESSGGLRPLNFKGNKFMQNTQNFFNPTKRKLNLFKKDFDFTDKEREDGFYNRLTLYPKNEEDENKSLKGDNLNPYSINWPSSFLKIGYSSGFYYDDYQDGVPILRLKRLRNKIYLPPIRNSRYSIISEKMNYIPSFNFNYMSRQERINYILNTENSHKNENNVFKSLDARTKLLGRFKLKALDEYKITVPKIKAKKSEEEEEEEEESDEDEEDKEEEDDENEDNDDGDDDKNEEDDGSSHPNEIE